MNTPDMALHWRHLGVAALAAGALVVAACGGDDTASGSGSAKPNAASSDGASSCVSKAKAAAQEATAEPSAPDMPKLDASKLAGKRVTLILSGGTPYTFAIADGFKEAAKAAGMKPTVFSGSREVTAWNHSINTAVAQGTDALVLLSVSPKLVSGALQKVIEAKIPIVDSFDEGVDAPHENGVYANVDLDQGREGKIEMDWILADSGCKANVLVPTIPSYVATSNLTTNAQDELKALCSSCKAYPVEIDVSKLATALPLQVSTALQQHPDINYVLAPFDASVPYILPAIQQRSSKAKVVGSNGLPDSLKMVAGSGPQVADFASAPGPFVGYQLFNKALQAMSDLPAQNEKIPDRLIDAKNVGSGDIDSLFPGLADYKTAYADAWGIG